LRIDLSKVPAEQRAQAEKLAAELASIAKKNPLQLFAPHCDEQQKFLAAHTSIVAAFCGNQSGKSTIGAVKALVNLLSRDAVPVHLQQFRQRPWELPTHGWGLCPSEDKIFDSLLPALKKWCPQETLYGQNWRRAFNAERMQLTFRNGSTLTFKTYKQDPSTLGGATLDFVWYDEPPPRAHRDEAATRLLATGGPEWYTMTPLKANSAWIRRDIWRQRAADHITVCKWSMHDNPHLNKARVKELLESYVNDIWRRAREFGDFMDIAGLVYADMPRCAVQHKPKRDEFRSWDHVWGIDPGIRNAAIVCGGFDHHGVDHIYDEALIQNGTPTQYAQAIDILAARYGLTRKRILFVIDPAARQRSQATGDTVQSELARVGIFTVNGNNDREAGQQQIRDRILHRRLVLYERCTGLLADADEFAWEMSDDDTDIGPADDSPFHRLATLRYQVMVRPFYPADEQAAPERDLGRPPDRALPAHLLTLPAVIPPMGSMS
jgi:phage terminase large subunit-like protein